MADRVIVWLEHCGYEIVEKPHAEAGLCTVKFGGRKRQPI